MDELYIYLVERKADGKQFAMLTNLKSRNWMNMGCGKYLFDFVPEDYKYGTQTPFGKISNVTAEVPKYNTRQYRVVRNAKFNYDN